MNTNWAVTGIPSWLTVSQSKGYTPDKITISTATNNSTNDIDRSVTLTLTSTDKDYKRSDYITVTVKQSGSTPPSSGKINGHEYVDLGLPSGLLWATCNVGASKPEEYGNYYAWGETSTKSDYSWSTYLKDLGGKMTGSSDCGTAKDPLRSYVYYNNVSISGTQYDAARKNWGGTWRMLTKDEMQELIDNTAIE